MYEHAKKVISERKSALDLFLIVFPASVMANILSSVFLEQKVSQFAWFAFAFMGIVLGARFYEILKSHLSEYILADELFLDPKRKKVLIAYGTKNIKAVFNKAYKNFLERNSVNEGSETELIEHQIFGMDVFEYFIEEVIEECTYKMVQSTKYSYESTPDKHSKPFSYKDLPQKLKNENEIFFAMTEAMSGDSRTISHIAFYMPFASKMNYVRSSDSRGGRKIEIRNKYGLISIEVSPGPCGRGAYKKEFAGRGYISFIPRIHFSLKTNPMFFFGKNYKEFLIWAEWVSEQLKFNLPRYVDLKGTYA